MKTFSCFLAAAVIATAAETSPSGAPIQLTPVDVTSDRDKPLTVPSLDEARIELDRTPGGTEVIDAVRYLRGRASTASDIFNLSPGVFAQSRFGSDEARISIRGSGLQRTFHGRGVRILQDGVPLNLADGSFDMQAFEPLAARYVNVWRGANALAFGASTLGGAIDFVSRTGRDSGPTLRLEAGSFGYVRASASADHASGAQDAHATFTVTRHDGYRDHAQQENARVFANAGWRLTDDIETRFFLTAVTTDSELPGSLFKSEAETSPRLANPTTAAQDQRRDFNLVRGASKTTARLGATVVDASLAWTYKDLDHPISPVVDQVTNDQLVSLTATHVGELTGRAHRFKAGLMWTRGATNAANYVNQGGERGPVTALADTTATNTELWLEDQLALTPRFTLVAGSTFAWVRRVNDQELGGAGSYAREYRNASPKVGFRWEALPAVQFFGNVSASFEPPSFSETGALTAPNRAQRGRTLELGTRGTESALRWDFAVYAAELRDEFLSLNDANGTPLGTINAPRTTHAGVELFTELDLLGHAWNAEAAPRHRLVLRAAWTYGQFRFDDDPVYRENTLAGFPPHIVRGELTWEHVDGWYAGPAFEWVPRRAPVDFANTLFADAYALLGFRLGRRIDAGFSWFAEVRNVLDENYVATTGVIANARGLDVRQFLPGEPRSFYCGVDYRW